MYNSMKLSRDVLGLIDNYRINPEIFNSGIVESVGDGIARVSGLSSCKLGELLEFEDESLGIAFNLERDYVGVVLLEVGYAISSGSTVLSTGQVIQVPVGDSLIGRMVNPLGQPLDGKGTISKSVYRRVEAEAPSIIDRAPVNTPLETGLTVIDAIVPIGRGQRELIIGDRQTGKTSIAIDTILNQKDKNVICIYVAIGQKASSVSHLKKTLEEMGAMEYTIIVCATASDTAPMQYIAPYAGTAMAEEFMYQGKDVLIIYDDLSKHAVAYREISLLLRRPPGREAYPGDVFYLHSRLLERSAHLSERLGGGSITSLPIIETMAGDISAYIPTNVISITDGQIFLETELFNSGIRPAVNVGLSVSRVGGAAQNNAMKKVSSNLRLQLAQYRELAAFARFNSDLDASAQSLLDQGARLTELMKQDNYSPLPLSKKVLMLYVVSNSLLDDINVSEVNTFIAGFLDYMFTHHTDTINSIDVNMNIDPKIEEIVISALSDYKKLIDVDNKNEKHK